MTTREEHDAIAASMIAQSLAARRDAEYARLSALRYDTHGITVQCRGHLNAGEAHWNGHTYTLTLSPPDFDRIQETESVADFVAGLRIVSPADAMSIEERIAAFTK